MLDVVVDFISIRLEFKIESTSTPESKLGVPNAIGNSKIKLTKIWKKIGKMYNWQFNMFQPVNTMIF